MLNLLSRVCEAEEAGNCNASTRSGLGSELSRVVEQERKGPVLFANSRRPYIIKPCVKDTPIPSEPTPISRTRTHEGSPNP